MRFPVPRSVTTWWFVPGKYGSQAVVEYIDRAPSPDTYSGYS